MDLIKALNEQQLKEVPQVEVGDTVRVHVKVKEGARERIQVFEGIVIAKKHGGPVYRQDRDCASRLCSPREAVLPA